MPKYGLAFAKPLLFANAPPNTMAASRAQTQRFQIREALDSDIPALRPLIELSVRVLQAGDYTPAQLEKALASVYGVDTQLIADRTYYVVEVAGGLERPSLNAPRLMVGCGGWSKRKTLYGGDQWIRRDDDLLDPRKDAAKIRAFFVHPDWTRQGIGTLLLDTCERAAIAAGFSSLEMGATLSGVPLYKARGYVELENLAVPLPGGDALAILHMKKTVSR